MMGPGTGQQDRFFYEFNIEDRISADHLLRRIDTVLDLSWLRTELLPFYSHTGCPSVDPELMIRMLLVSYCYSIRSERRLCQEVELNLAYRWFCHLGLEDKVPNHSTFSVNRHGRFRDGDIFRKVFERVVRQCMDAGLVKGEGFAVDASVIEADASRFQRIEGAEVAWSQDQLARRAIREYLAALESENSPINAKQKPKAISPTDPTAAWTKRGRNKVMFAYSLNYLIDMDNAVILDVEATPTRITKEVAATRTMLERTKQTFNLQPDHIAGDVAYGTNKLLGWLVERDIDPHVPVWDKWRRGDETFSRANFSYDKENDVYICPEGKTLKTSGNLNADNTWRYGASKHDCTPCPLKSKCCPRMPARRVPRMLNEDARDYTRSLGKTEAYGQSVRDRKKIERLFGEAKRNLSMTRLRLRGLTGAKDEFLLTATVQNLKRLVHLNSKPPPQPKVA